VHLHATDNHGDLGTQHHIRPVIPDGPTDSSTPLQTMSCWKTLIDGSRLFNAPGRLALEMDYG
jgi:hypothetical protein